MLDDPQFIYFKVFSRKFQKRNQLQMKYLLS